MTLGPEVLARVARRMRSCKGDLDAGCYILWVSEVGWCLLLSLDAALHWTHARDRKRALQRGGEGGRGEWWFWQGTSNNECSRGAGFLWFCGCGCRSPLPHSSALAHRRCPPPGFLGRAEEVEVEAAQLVEEAAVRKRGESAVPSSRSLNAL